MRVWPVLLALLLALPVASAAVTVERIDAPERTRADQAFPVALALRNDGPARDVYLFGALYDAEGGPCGPATDPRFRTFTHLVQERVHVEADGSTIYPAAGERWLHRYGAEDVDPAPRSYQLCIFVANASTGTATIDYEAFGTRTLSARGVNAAPVASFTWAPERARETEDVRFEASASDAEGDPVTFAWDFGHLNASGRAVAQGSEATTFFYPAGDYVVTLVASDGMDETRVARTLAIAPGEASPHSDPGDGRPIDVPLGTWLAPCALLLVALGRRR